MSIRFFTNAPNEDAASVADEDDNLMRKRAMHMEARYTHANFSVFNSSSPSHRYATSGPSLAAL
jgi:hypothetical protein